MSAPGGVTVRPAGPGDALGLALVHVRAWQAAYPGLMPQQYLDGLDVLNVHPDHWSAGVGSALLRTAESGLSGLGFRSAVLWVVPGNARARRFYERHGWVAEDVERTAGIQGVTVPETRYRRPLLTG